MQTGRLHVPTHSASSLSILVRGPVGGQHSFLSARVPRLLSEEKIDVWESCVGSKAWPVYVQGPGLRGRGNTALCHQ